MPTGFGALGPPQGGQRHRGHAHFWERAMSRGVFIKTAAGATGAMVTSGLWMPGLARAAPATDATPKPISGRFTVPGVGTFDVSGGIENGVIQEPATITDFKGIVGLAFVQGTGTGTDTATGATTSLLFDSDNRFMVGEYVAVDGHRYRGTFGFV